MSDEPPPGDHAILPPSRQARAVFRAERLSSLTDRVPLWLALCIGDCAAIYFAARLRYKQYVLLHLLTPFEAYCGGGWGSRTSCTTASRRETWRRFGWQSSG